MKVPSRSIYFFRSRARHLHYGRGNQLKAGGLHAEKREQESWLILRIMSRSHRSLWSTLGQSMNQWLHSPLHRGRDALTEILLFVSLSRTPRSPAFAYICQPRSGIRDFDLVMTTSLKSEVISLRRNSNTCQLAFEYYLGNSANFRFSVCVWISSHSCHRESSIGSA